MNRISDDDLGTFRALAQELARRVQEDPSLRQAIEQDPVAVLVEAGLPAHLVPLFLRETDLGDVMGYMDELERGCLVSEIFIG